MRLSAVVLLLGGLACSGLNAAAEQVDPFGLVDRAMAAYQAEERYSDMRAVLSAGLRAASAEGSIGEDFAVVYAIYSDMARFEGNAAFALQLADEGIRLVHAQDQVDREYENMLLVSRSYALADLGRYEEAVKYSRIPAIWLGERFGTGARKAFEAEIANWNGTLAGGEAPLPDAVQLAVDLLNEAESLANEGATDKAHALASRAMLPASAGLDALSLRFINGWSQAVSAYAFQKEGRSEAALALMLQAADTILGFPWDPTKDLLLPDDLVRDEGAQSLLWDIFSNIGAFASAAQQDPILATAALNVAEHWATTSPRRFTLLVQRAAVMMLNKDYRGAEATMTRSAREAEAAGDRPNAALAKLYAVLASFYHTTPESGDHLRLLKAAEEAAGTALDLGQREFILTTAVRQASMIGMPTHLMLPIARQAMVAFRERQGLLGTDSVGRDATRRERRRFLETIVAAELGSAVREQFR